MKKLIAVLILAGSVLLPTTTAHAISLRGDHRCFVVGTRPNGRTIHHRVRCNQL